MTTSPLKSSSPLTTRPTFTNKISNDHFLQILGQSDPELQISLISDIFEYDVPCFNLGYIFVFDMCMYPIL